MAPYIIVDRAGHEHAVEGSLGRSLMENVRAAGYGELLALCAGSCSCATCHVYIEDGPVDQLSAMSDDENTLLDSSQYRTPRSRLSCQIEFTEQLAGLRVRIPPED